MTFAQAVFRKRFRPNDASSGCPADYSPDIALNLFTRADGTKTHIRYDSEGMAVETIDPLGKSRQRSAEREKIALFVTISDDNETEELENESARVLNRPAVFDRFIKCCE
ncbi:hypothetical protein [Burkholderia pyrrocinia]|uniref:hypothetical protein n=1 Tax=Burkholderia pyrrocinia TaxID=60550 RepID=UPI001BCBDF39|nr:hypothetical protein [Burkholderia pyrrocinia]QVN23581.1 hypothetical protein JYG32_34545 [Burkholderia pyrrocinia]